MPERGFQEQSRHTLSRQERFKLRAREALRGFSLVSESLVTQSRREVEEALKQQQAIAGDKDREPAKYVEALQRVDGSWSELVKRCEVVSWTPEYAHAVIESCRAELIVSNVDEAARDKIAYLPGHRSPACIHCQNTFGLDKSAQGQESTSALAGMIAWNGLDCREIDCGKPRVSPSVFCEQHHRQTLDRKAFYLKGVPLERQPTQVGLPPGREVVLIALQHYQAPYCCACNQPKANGREYKSVYLCDDCRSIALRRIRQRKYRVHVPIMVALMLVPGVMAYLIDRHDLQTWLALFGLVDVFYYSFVFLVAPTPDEACTELAWTCMKIKAMTHGCPQFYRDYQEVR